MTDGPRTSRFEILAAVAEFADASLSPRETVARLLDLVVPELADACMVDFASVDGTVERLGVRFSGPRAAELEAALATRPLSPVEAPRSETRTLTTGESQVFEVTEELLRAAAHGPEDLELLRAFDLGWLVFVPLRARGRTLGVVSLATRGRERAFDDEDRRFAEVLSGRLALALDNARLRDEVREVEHELAGIISGLAEAVTVQDPQGQLVYANQAAADLLGLGSPTELVEAGGAETMRRFEVRHADGRPLSIEELPGRRVLAGEEPEPLLVRSRPREHGEELWCVIKATALRDAAGRVRMAVNVIENVTEQKRSELAHALLARASEVLGASLDYEATLAQVAELAVPELADWCAFEIPDGRGALRNVAIAHADPAKVELARQLRELYPVDPRSDTGLPAVFRTGLSQLYPEIPDEMLTGAARDDRHLAMLREIGFTSALIVPVTAGAEVLGVLTLVSSESGRRFNEADVELAEELGRRAGTAVANARLFSQRSEIAQTLQRSLLPPELPELPGWSLASLFRAAGEANEVGGDFYDVFEAGAAWYALIGDVAGKGAAAAALTSLVRYTLRSAITLTGDQAAAMAQLNGLLRDRRELSLCTVACLRLRGDMLDVTCAGHPRPLRIRAGVVEEVGETEPMLGAFDERRWHTTAVPVEPGDGIVLYTDGVVDTVGERDRFGERRLHEVLAASEPTGGGLIAGLQAALDGFACAGQADDTAALALVRQPGHSY